MDVLGLDARLEQTGFPAFRDYWNFHRPYPDAGTESAKQRWEDECRAAWESEGRQRHKVLEHAQSVHACLHGYYRGICTFCSVRSDGVVRMGFPDGYVFEGRVTKGPA